MLSGWASFLTLLILPETFSWAQAPVLTTINVKINSGGISSVSLDHSGRLFVLGNTIGIAIVDPSGAFSTIAGLGTSSADGISTDSATLIKSTRLRFDNEGNLVVADVSRIRKIDSTTGKISTIAGSQSNGFSGDGGPALGAQLNSPAGFTFDATGNLHIADTGNFRIRRVDAGTGVITTVAGGWRAGYAGLFQLFVPKFGSLVG